jgi:hypothetical protein
VLLTFDEYREECARAKTERLAQAGWLAMCELKPQLASIPPADGKGFASWVKAVNKRAAEIFARAN